MGDAQTPYLSIVVTGRNDGYGGDFLGRFLATLHFNHAELSARGVPHEFVLVEWGPPPGRPLLADEVAANEPAAAAALRAIVVDAEYQDALTLNPRLRYHEFIAKNVGVRRAYGAYVLSTNCDTFLGRHILDRLAARDLESAVVYRAARYDLKAETDYRHATWATLEDPGNLERPARALRPPHFAGGTGDFILLDLDSYARLRGFNEVYRVARFGIDRNFLVHALAGGISIADIGGLVYHVNHEDSFRVTRNQYARREWEAPYGDDRWPHQRINYHNGADWGLARAPERAIGPRRTRLVFDWRALPPLVDLSAITIPPRPKAGGTTVA